MSRVLPRYGVVLGWALLVAGSFQPIWIATVIADADEPFTWGDVIELVRFILPSLIVLIGGVLLALSPSASESADR